MYFPVWAAFSLALQSWQRALQIYIAYEDLLKEICTLKEQITNAQKKAWFLHS